MAKYEILSRAGQFEIGGQTLQADLTLNGSKTSLHVVSPSFFKPDANSDRAIFGVLRDLTCVSMLKCNAPPIPGDLSNRRDKIWEADIFPHFVISGSRHLGPNSADITAIRVWTDDASTIFYDFDAFAFSLNPQLFIDELTAANALSSKREIAVGDRPEIAYFTGRSQIFSVDTVIGTISANHNVSSNMGGPQGVYIRNAISTEIAFARPVVFDAAIEALISILFFLQLMAGRPQNIINLAVDIGAGEDPVSLKVHWSLPPMRSIDGDHEPHPAEVPIMAAREPAVFGTVLARWLEREPAWRDARSRFALGFGNANSYGIDRLVAAANLFDILTDEAAPERIAVSSELEAAREAAKTLFKALPQSGPRDSILSALGRIGVAALRDKVKYRARVVQDAFPGQFPDLENVIELAVDCRNHYVHGSPPKINYTAHFFETLPFLTDTLEFIFAASDLLDAGWDPTAWSNRGTSMAHPLASYRATYKPHLLTLMVLPRNSPA